MSRIRGGSRKRQQARVGAPDRSLTANAGLAAVTELCGRLGVTGAIDAAAGPVKQRDRGFCAGELLTGLAAVTGRMMTLLPPERAAALAGGPVTIGLDATDVEVSADLPVMPRAVCRCCPVS